MHRARVEAERIAAANAHLVTRAQLVSVGMTRREVTALLDVGEWTRVGRGVYATRRPRNLRERVTWVLAGEPPSAVIGLSTAARLFGWQGLDPDDRDVHVVLDRRHRHGQRLGVRRHWWDLNPADVQVIDGIRVTTAARTAADLIPRLDRRRGLSVLDSALHQRALDAQTIAAARVIARGRHHVASDSDVWDLADGRAESPLESRCRLDCVDAGFTPDDLQVPLVDPVTGETWFGDIGWKWKPGRWLIGECDGERVHSWTTGGGPHPLYADRHRQNGIVIGTSADVLHFTWRDHNRGLVSNTIGLALQRGRLEAV